MNFQKRKLKNKKRAGRERERRNSYSGYENGFGGGFSSEGGFSCGW